MVTTLQTIANPIVLSYYLGLVNKRWWQFKDANTGDIVQIKCMQSSLGKLEVSIHSDNIQSQHFLSVDGSEFWGQKFAWLESHDKTYGLINWSNGGIKFPYGWKPGDSTSGVTEGSVAGLGHGILTLTFTKFTQLQVPTWSPLPHSNGIFTPYGDDHELNKTAVIEVIPKLIIKESGVNLVSGFLYFAYGIGIVNAKLNIFGVQLILDLQKWGNN